MESQVARQSQYQHLHRSLTQIQRSEQDKAAYAEQAIEESRVIFDSIAALYGQEETAQAAVRRPPPAPPGG